MTQLYLFRRHKKIYSKNKDGYYGLVKDLKYVNCGKGLSSGFLKHNKRKYEIIYSLTLGVGQYYYEEIIHIFDNEHLYQYDPTSPHLFTIMEPEDIEKKKQSDPFWFSLLPTNRRDPNEKSKKTRRNNSDMTKVNKR
jgi:hypothetical protein